MTAQEVLRKEYGSDASAIEIEIKDEIDFILMSGGSQEEIEDLLLGYGMEMDYIFDLI